jgi:hypothetical protein
VAREGAPELVGRLARCSSAAEFIRQTRMRLICAAGFGIFHSEPGKQSAVRKQEPLDRRGARLAAADMDKERHRSSPPQEMFVSRPGSHRPLRGVRAQGRLLTRRFEVARGAASWCCRTGLSFQSAKNHRLINMLYVP